MAAFHEHTKRSINKALTFRGIVLMSDGVIIFLITHRYDVALAVIVFSNIASTALYFFHERAWNKVHWGKTRSKFIVTAENTTTACRGDESARGECVGGADTPTTKFAPMPRLIPRPLCGGDRMRPNFIMASTPTREFSFVV